MSPLDAETLALIDDLTVRLAQAHAEIERLRAALRQITLGEGEFSLDRFEFACNVVESQKQIARAALEQKP